MANSVEDPMKRIIERLDRKNLTWEGEDRAILALFVALLKTRNPAFDGIRTSSPNSFIDGGQRRTTLRLMWLRNH